MIFHHSVKSLFVRVFSLLLYQQLNRPLSSNLFTKKKFLNKVTILVLKPKIIGRNLALKELKYLWLPLTNEYDLLITNK